MRATLTLLHNLLRLLLWPLRRLARQPCDALRFTLEGSPPPLPVRRPFWDRRPPPMSVRTFQRRIERAARDRSLPAILVDVGPLAAGWSTLETLRELLAAAGRRGGEGRRVVAFLPRGGGIREYYVATGADEILMPPSAALTLTGLSVEATYLAPALARSGVTAQIEAMGRYKTAGEPFVKDRMSDESREVLGDVLAEVEALAVESVAAGRTVSGERARELLGGGPYDAKDAERLGLVDGVCYPDQIPARMAPPDRRKARIRRWAAWARGRVLELGRWPWQRHRLAVVELRGVIVDGKGPGLAGVLGATEAVAALRKVRADRAVAAVVLYVDSRGGTALGSDQIRREVERLGRRKPVVAYMAEVAASGGYMVAAAAHQVVARRATLTGSIGVIAAKVSVGRLLEGLGLRRQVVRLAGNTAFLSPTEAWTAGERDAVRAMIATHYRHFVEGVARGRRLPVERIEAAAEGRVWTGRAALELGLVDRLGGLADAIEAARQTSPAARRALVEPVRPASRRFPKLPLGPLAGEAAPLVALALGASAGAPLAFDPMDLQLR